MKQLRRLGSALMLPVAVLPAAGVLMGIGYWIDPSGWGANNAFAALLIKSGSSIIDHLPILFAVGIAYGLSKDKDGAASLSGLVAYLLVTTVLSTESVSMLRQIPVEEVSPAFGAIENAFIGIISGVVGASMYNRFYQIQLPKALSFFSGRRLAPIMTSVAMLVVSALLLFVWPVVYEALVAFGQTISNLGAVGAGLFGFFNRLLIPTGLHHALNSVFWFDTIGIDDIGKFWGQVSGGVKGVTGMYQAGFFPIMMFGLPGAALAMYRNAKSENKEAIGSLMLAAAFASFFTGITEPLEFSFMFVAPALYVVHALLTGISLFIAASLQWTAGFTFSAGLVDFVLSSKLPLANKPWMLLLQGIIYFGLYYLLFNFLIQKFDFLTPGRDVVTEDEQNLRLDGDHQEFAKNLLLLLGGQENISTIDHCATRLRLDVKDMNLVQTSKIEKMNVAGVRKMDKHNLQIIIGPDVQFVADALRGQVK